MSNVIKTVSIKIGQKMYGTFYSLPNTFAHALADFVDNAVQSYVDSKTNLRAIDSTIDCVLILISIGRLILIRLN